MIENSYDEETGSIRDLKIDDRDIKRAKNYFHFCSELMEDDAKMPFSRQLWMGYHLLGEYCPKCSNPKWENIENVPVDFDSKNMPEHVQFLENGVCPKCKVTRSQLLMSGKLNNYQELDGCLGQRAGKTTWSTGMAAYIIQCHLKLPQLSTICKGIKEASPITGTFIGLRLSDAMDLLWKPIVGIIDNSPWFKAYHQMLSHYGNKYGREIYKKRDVYIRYVHKNLDLYPSGPTKRGLRGRTRFLALTDEIGWFPMDETAKEGSMPLGDDRERADANGVYDALDRSLATVRVEVDDLLTRGMNTVPNGIQICISSPSSRQDKIWRLITENKNSKMALAVNLPTWEINPRYHRNHPLILKAYENNAETAERDWGAVPPKGAAAFIGSERIKECFSGFNRVLITQAEKNIDGRNYRAGKASKITLPNYIAPSLLAIDAGYSNNAFAVVVARRERLRVIVEAIGEIVPGDGYVLHYNAIYKAVLAPLITQLNVQYLFADRWQSLAHLHRAQEELKIHAEQFSVKKKDFDLVRNKLEDGEIILPKVERIITDEEASVNYPKAFKGNPAAHLQFQCLTVKEVGQQVIKGDGYTDDIWRALCLAVSRLFDEDVAEEMLRIQMKRRNTGTLGAASGRSSNYFVVGNVSNRLGAMGRRN